MTVTVLRQLIYFLEEVNLKLSERWLQGEKAPPGLGPRERRYSTRQNQKTLETVKEVARNREYWHRENLS